jgi:energy-coupling factor transporter ATP-binding protein EcfA2
MITLKTLKILRFRNVEPGTTLRFRDGYNVLLGKNATGKTTLLELLARAISLDLSPYSEEPFNIHFQLSNGATTLRVEAENTPVDADSVYGASLLRGLEAPQLRLIPKVSLFLEKDGHPGLRYTSSGASVEIQQGPGQRTMEYPLRFPILDGNLLYPILFSGSTKGNSLDYSTIQPFQIGRLIRFDESLTFFQRILTESRVHAWIARDGKVHAGTILAPNAVSAIVSKALTGRHNPATIPVANLPLLDRLNSLLGFRSAILYLERLEKTAATEESPEQVEYGNFRFEFTRYDKSTIDHSRLSYGQKRLLAFHFWLATFDGFAIADELVNGLHHEWISSSVEALDHRQSFLTTQHPLLLDYLRFDTEEAVAESFIVCKSTPAVAPPERMQWTNISERDAIAFYRAYRSGIQNVSEILVSRGLW